MNAIHKLRTAVFVGSLSLVALGMLAAPAEATKPYSNLYAHHHAVHGNTLQYFPATTLHSPVYRTAHIAPTYKFRPAPVCHTVMLYDAFGRPYIVHATSYSTLLR